MRWALAAAVMAPALLLGAAAWHAWEAAWRSAEAEVARTADAAAEYARRLLEAQLLRIERVNELLAGLSDEEIRAHEPALHEALRRIAAEREPAEQESFYVFVYDRNAVPLVTSNLLPAPKSAPVLAEREFNQVLRSDGAPWIHVSPLYLGTVTRRPYFAVSGRRTRTGNDLPVGSYDGVVNASVYVDHAAPALRALAATPADMVSLVRSDGAYLAHVSAHGDHLTEGAWLPSSSALLAALSGGDERGLVQTVSPLDGIERILAFRQVGGGWPVYATAARDRAAIVATWRRQMAPQALLAAGSMVLLVALALAVRRRQYELEEANGTLERRVAERTAAVQERERFLLLAQQAAGVASWSWNPATGEVRWSPQVYELLGLGPAAEGSVPSFDGFMAAVHPEDRRRLRSALADALRDGAMATEFRVFRRTPEGGREEIWLLRRARLYVNEDGRGGPPTLVGIDVDITERRRAEERFEAATSAMDGFVYEWDIASGQIRRADGVSALLGTELEGTLEAWRARMHPEDRPRIEAELEARFADPACGRYAVEYRVQRADGGWAWVWDRARIFRDPDTGSVTRVVGGAVDVTLRRQAEERQALLLREMDHRAKNALAVVKAALKLTPRNDAEAYAKAIDGRIDALARAQTLLAETRWGGAGLRDLLEGALAPFLGGGSDNAPQAVLDGPRVWLTGAATQPLSMALHELATNATKYGALSLPGGRLRVGWWLRDGMLHIRWEETGGPPVGEPPTRRGFGSRVIDATIRTQLGGEAQWHWSPAGLSVDLALPVGRAVLGEGSAGARARHRPEFAAGAEP